MPLLQEVTPKRELLSAHDVAMKQHEDSTAAALKQHHHAMSPMSAFPVFAANAGMFTPSQLLMASQLMAASGLGLPPNPAFFHPSLYGGGGSTAPHTGPTLPWSAHSPPSPPTSSNDQLSPALKSTTSASSKKLMSNHNNNLVTSSSPLEVKRRRTTKRIKLEDDVLNNVPLSSPTSSSSSPSPPGSETKDTHRDKQFTCGVCNRSFGYKHVLQNHERTHTGEKPFECTECHKKFTRDHHLKTHMRLHTGERPYHCDHCDRQFVQVANLRRHLRVHTGERPYACEHCSAKFSDSNQLKAHVLIHTNEKPFSCERCQSRFRRRHHLIHHKCGVPITETEATSLAVAVATNASTTTSPVSEPEVKEEVLVRHRRILRAPLVSLPTYVTLPEQTEPEDLSMSTGLHSHSSGGDSPLSRSPSSPAYEEEDYELEDITTQFLQRTPGVTTLRS